MEDDPAFHDQNAGCEFPGRHLLGGIQGLLVTIAGAVRARIRPFFCFAFIGGARGSRCDPMIMVASIPSYQAVDEVFCYEGDEEPGD